MTGPNVTYSCQSCGGVIVEGIPHHCSGTPAPRDRTRWEPVHPPTLQCDRPDWAEITPLLGPHRITPAEAAESGVVSHTREPGFACWWDGLAYHDTPRRAYEAAMARKRAVGSARG